MIRKAELTDAENIINLVYPFYHLTEYPEFAEFDRPSVKDITVSLIEHGIVFIAVVDGTIVGVIGCAVIPFMFNYNILTCCEVIFWLNPEHQKTGLGAKMIHYTEVLAKSRGIKRFVMVHLKNSPPQAAKLYEAVGFSPSEICYSKVL